MRTILTLMILVLTTGCVYAPSLPPIKDNGKSKPVVFIKHAVTVSEDGKDKLSFFLYFNVDGYDMLVQEVMLDGGETLVETFRNGGYDTHFRAREDAWTECLIYPAKVEGVDATVNGFAQLPQNLDGSVKTTIGDGFNADYQSKHKTQGRVTKAARHLATRWKITWKGGKATYEIQEGMEL